MCLVECKSLLTHSLTQVCGEYGFIAVCEVEVDSDEMSLSSCLEPRTTSSRKRQKPQLQSKPLSPIADEHGEAVTDESHPRRSKR